MERLSRLGIIATASAIAVIPSTGRATCVDASLLEPSIGSELAMPFHLQDGDELTLPLDELLDHGRRLFEAMWTVQEGGGRPETTGVGSPLADPSDPLVFPRNFNRLSAPDANSCFGCHNLPFPGGGGDHVTNVFVLGQRFDFATFDGTDDDIPKKGSADELGVVDLQTFANDRATIGMFGAGFIEMLARQMTADLQAIRDGLAPGEAAELRSKGVSFGPLKRKPDGSYDVSAVDGLPAASVTGDSPSLIVRPFHQVGNVVSLRQFTNNAFNHHHGIQAVERFGDGADPDDDGFCNEMTRADVTAVTAWQATLQVPAQVVPRDRPTADAVLLGEHLFDAVGCTACHVPKLPLTDRGWIFVEPNPFNPAGNLQAGDAPDLAIDLTSERLPQPRLKASHGMVDVPAFTDLRLHDITTGPDDPNCEPLDQNAGPADPAFFDGNCRFLTKKLWGAGNEPPFFHHGKFTTMRQAIDAHHGEAASERQSFEALPACGQAAVIEFLKSLQVVPAGTNSIKVDQNYEPRRWPPHDRQSRLADALAACAIPQ